MPVDEAVHLPSTPLPVDELEGELGGHSLQLVKEINALAAAHEELRVDHDALEDSVGQNEALDASEGQLAEVDTRLTAEIAQVADDVNQAAISAVDALANEVDAALEAVATEAAGYADVSATLTREEVARSADDVRAAAISAVDELANEVDVVVSAASEESAGYAETLKTDLRAEIAQSADDTAALALSEVDALAAEVVSNAESASLEVAGYAETVETDLRAEIAQAADDAAALALSAVDALANEVDAGLTAASVEAAGYAETVGIGLRAEIAQSVDDQGGLLAAEVGDLNDRIGEFLDVVQTNDAVPTVLATIPIPRFRSVRLKVEIYAERTDLRQRALYTIEALVRAIPSLGTLTVGGVPNDGDQVEIDGVTYTFKAVPAAAFDVQRDAGTAEGNIDNLVAAIVLAGTPGTEYHVDTTLHPSVTARKDTAATMEAVAKLPGVAGDAITTSDPTDVVVVLSWGGATLATGSDATVSKYVDRDDVEDDAAWGKDLVAGVGHSVDVEGTGAAGADIDWIPVVQMTAI